ALGDAQTLEIGGRGLPDFGVPRARGGGDRGDRLDRAGGDVARSGRSARQGYGLARTTLTAGRAVLPTWSVSHRPLPISSSSTREASRYTPGRVARKEKVADPPGWRPPLGLGVAASRNAGRVARLLAVTAHE